MWLCVCVHLHINNTSMCPYAYESLWYLLHPVGTTYIIYSDEV